MMHGQRNIKLKTEELFKTLFKPSYLEHYLF